VKLLFSYQYLIIVNGLDVGNVSSSILEREG
jgi:hypothetical protein